MFNNAEGKVKDTLKKKYNSNHSEKKFPEKKRIKDKTEGTSMVAVYDLQAVM